MSQFFFNPDHPALDLDVSYGTSETRICLLTLALKAQIEEGVKQVTSVERKINVEKKRLL